MTEPDQGEKRDETRSFARMIAAATAPRAPILEVQGLQMHFVKTKGLLSQREVARIRAVDGVSFDLRPGETLGLVGESGCGKSTVARLLCGLEKPTGGSALFEGRDIVTAKGKDLRQMRRNIQ